jgi:hypothetical protein
LAPISRCIFRCDLPRLDKELLHCMSPLLAQSGHAGRGNECLLLGVKRTSLRDG